MWLDVQKHVQMKIWPLKMLLEKEIEKFLEKCNMISKNLIFAKECIFLYTKYDTRHKYR